MRIGFRKFHLMTDGDNGVLQCSAEAIADAAGEKIIRRLNRFKSLPVKEMTIDSVTEVQLRSVPQITIMWMYKLI